MIIVESSAMQRRGPSPLAAFHAADVAQNGERPNAWENAQTNPHGLFTFIVMVLRSPLDFVPGISHRYLVASVSLDSQDLRPLRHGPQEGVDIPLTLTNPENATRYYHAFLFHFPTPQPLPSSVVNGSFASHILAAYDNSPEDLSFFVDPHVEVVRWWNDYSNDLLPPYVVVVPDDDSEPEPGSPPMNAEEPHIFAADWWNRSFENILRAPKFTGTNDSDAALTVYRYWLQLASTRGSPLRLRIVTPWW